MPPKGQPKTVLAEEALAARVTFEREGRGWSPGGLASRMTQAGCPMTQSAIWKIENGNPRRRITFDEAVTFARVFEMALEDLSMPPEFVAAERASAAAQELAWKIESVEKLVYDEIPANYSDLTRAIQSDKTGTVVRAVARVASGEISDPWSASAQERLELAQSPVPDLGVLDAWLDGLEARLVRALEWASRTEVSDGTDA